MNVMPCISFVLLTCVQCMALGLDLSVRAVRGDVSRKLLGDGTGARVAFIDGGIDFQHPALRGTDSQGQPRIQGYWNLVPSETRYSESFHGTAVAGVALGNDPVYRGMAPDAQYLSVRVFDSLGNGSPMRVITDGVGVAIDQGANVLNLSLNAFSPVSDGRSQIDLMLDWAASQQHVSSVVCAGNIYDSTTVRDPSGAFNSISVGRTDSSFRQVDNNSATAFTTDGRMKPDLVAPGTGITTANYKWETESDYRSADGCSFAVPHVSGMIAQLLEAGYERGWSTNPLVIKATMLNAADRSVLNKDGTAWTPASVATINNVALSLQPLAVDSGAGQIDGARLAQQYLAGQQSPGAVPAVGWDIRSFPESGYQEYTIDGDLRRGTTLNATLAWLRNVTRTDDGNGLVDNADTFVPMPLSNLDLQVLRNGTIISQSISTRDNVEMLRIPIDDPTATYSLRVIGTHRYNSLEQFGLAWWGDTSLLADLNQDASVDLLDAAILFEAWGGESELADLTDDGIVDGADAATLFSEWSFPNSLSSSMVPEPSSVTTFLCGMGILAWRRSKL